MRYEVASIQFSGLITHKTLFWLEERERKQTKNLQSLPITRIKKIQCKLFDLLLIYQGIQPRMTNRITKPSLGLNNRIIFQPKDISQHRRSTIIVC